MSSWIIVRRICLAAYWSDFFWEVCRVSSSCPRKPLGIHGAIEVLYMIGAGEVIDKIHCQEWDSLSVLSEDGTDGELLGRRLQLILSCLIWFSRRSKSLLNHLCPIAQSTRPSQMDDMISAGQGRAYRVLSGLKMMKFHVVWVLLVRCCSW